MRLIAVVILLFTACLPLSAEVRVVCRQSDPTIPPRGFASVSFAVTNSSALEAEYDLKASVSPPLRIVGAATRTLKVGASMTEVAVFNVYAPNGTTSGGSVRLVATDPATGGSATASAAFAVVPTPGFEARIISTIGQPVTVLSSTGDDGAPFDLVVNNHGNIPLQFVLEAQCTPAAATLGQHPVNFTVAPAETRKLSLTLANIGAATYTEAVAHIVLRASHDGNELEPSQHFVRLANYPDAPAPTAADLYKTLSVTAGFAAGYSGSSPLLFNTLALDGEIAPETFLHFNGQLSTLSDHAAFIPGYEARSQFRLALDGKSWLLEAGEVRRSFGRLIAAGERGTGVHAEAKLAPAVSAAVYAAENSATLSDKKTAGVNVLVEPAAAQQISFNAVTMTDDPDPKAQDWTAAGADWTYKPSRDLTLSLESAYGASEHGSGAATGAGVLWRAEPLAMPLEIGLEGGAGDEEFPGDQRGRIDGRVTLDLRPMKDVRISALHYQSEFRSTPFYEETIEELKSLTPDFQRRVASSASSVAATLEKGLPVTLRYDESVSFQKLQVEAETQERALTLSVTRPGPRLFTSAAIRGGDEERLGHGDAASSRFASLGFDATLPVSTSSREIALNAAGRYTHNLDDDETAVNRTGAWLNVGASVAGKNKRVAGSFNVDAYRYESGEAALRGRVGLHYRIGTQHELGIEGAYAQESRSSNRSETAVLFSYKYSFGAPLSWMPHRSSAQGVIFNDMNANGIRDPGEEGVPGVCVAVGENRALTDKSGAFRFAAMEPGKVPFSITSPEGTPLVFSSELPSETSLGAGKVEALLMGIVMPLRIDGEVQIARTSDLLPAQDTLTSVGIVATRKSMASGADATAEKTFRSFTRGDGTFSIYLEPGTYSIRPESVGAGQSVAPAELTITVEPGAPMPLPKFVVKDAPREIKRKVFRQDIASK